MSSGARSLLLLLVAGSAAALLGRSLWRWHVTPRPGPATAEERGALRAQAPEDAGTSVPPDPTDLGYWREQVRKVAARSAGPEPDAGTATRRTEEEPPPGAPGPEMHLAGRPLCRERAQVASRQFNEGAVYPAESEARAVLAEDPGCASARVVLGQIFYQRNDLSAALEQWELARRSAPDGKTLDPLIARVKRELGVEGKLGQRDSTNFSVSFDGRDDRDAAYRAVEILEEARGTLGRALDFFPADAVPVILYPGETFQETGRPAWSDGLYDGKIRLASSGAQKHPARFREVLYHEYTHALVHRLAAGQPVPAWVNEGLAQYAETLIPGGRGGDAVRSAKAEQRVPLNRLHAPFGRLTAHEADLAYTEARLAVADLVLSYRLYRLRELLEKLAQGHSFETAFDDTYPVSYGAFVKKCLER